MKIQTPCLMSFEQLAEKQIEMNKLWLTIKERTEMRTNRLQEVVEKLNSEVHLLLCKINQRDEERVILTKFPFSIKKMNPNRELKIWS